MSTQPGADDAVEDLDVTDNPMLVRTRFGWVKGVDMPELGVRSWRGIPYGQETSGQRRFASPVPVEPWEGVLECSQYGSPAPQPTYSWTDRIAGDEDCLHLDIVRPVTDEKLPVVVYLHGGSFIMGASHEPMLRGFHLARTTNVVYVSVNFRLGALGYLDLRSLSGDCTANPAVEDQLLALRWVRANIAAFGGDPDNVTLMGESAGGAAVLTLMSVPAAHGLFHRALAQSPPMGVFHSRTQSTFWARELVSRLGLPRMASVDDLRVENFADIVRAGQSMMWAGREFLHLNTSYAPTADENFLPEHPLEAFANGNQAQVPLLIGTNSDEASFGKFVYQRQKNRSKAAHRLLRSFDPDGAPGVLAAYNDATARSDFAELLADALFWAPATALASRHSDNNPTWMYRYDFAPPALRWVGLGAMHSLELANVFGDMDASRVSFLTKLGDSSDMERLTQEMQGFWGDFFHGKELDSSWPPYGTDQRITRIFDAKSSLEYDPKAERRIAWEGYSMTEWGVGRPEILEALSFLTEGLGESPNVQ